MYHYLNISIEPIIVTYPTGTELEYWRDVPGFEGLVQASTFGRIKSLTTPGRIVRKSKSTRRLKILKQKLSIRTGYLYISLTDLNGNRKTYLSHRIIAQTFLPNTENKKEVNHKDTVKTNNRVGNLEWVTSAENNKHAINCGLRPNKKGEHSDNTQLRNDQVLEIFNSTQAPSELAKIFAVGISVIYQIKNGKNWSSVTGKTYSPIASRIPESTIIEIFNCSLPWDKICEKYSISRKYLWSIKKKKIRTKLLEAL